MPKAIVGRTVMAAGNCLPELSISLIAVLFSSAPDIGTGEVFGSCAFDLLAVGDTAFRVKCIDVMRSLARSGRSIIFVSHELDMLERLCDRAIACSRLSGLPACPLRRPPSSWRGAWRHGYHRPPGRSCPSGSTSSDFFESAFVAEQPLVCASELRRSGSSLGAEGSA